MSPLQFTTFIIQKTVNYNHFHCQVKKYYSNTNVFLKIPKNILLFQGLGKVYANKLNDPWGKGPEDITALIQCFLFYKM